MPANVAGTVDLPIELFGGLVTDMPPADLPMGVSPDNQDIQFKVGSISTRPGLTRVFTAISGNPTVNYLKTYTQQNLAKTMLALDQLGVLWGELTPGTLTAITANPYDSVFATPPFGQSDTVFGREYIATGDGSFGIEIPRQYDRTYLDRVSQVGPGAPPQVQDDISSNNIVASPTGLVPIAGVGLDLIHSIHGVALAEITSVLPDINTFMQVGDVITVSGAAHGEYNGTYAISAITSPISFQYLIPTMSALPSDSGSLATAIVVITTVASTTVTTGSTQSIVGATDATFDGNYNIRIGGTGTSFYGYFAPILGVAASGGGSIGSGATSGNISAGVHQCVVIFKTRQGYLTHPSPPFSWTAAGGAGVVVSNIPIGPPNVVARILAFTAAGGSDFFYIPFPTDGSFSGTVLADNTTTTMTVDFTDIALLSATSINNEGNDLFALVELGESAGAMSYSNRVVWWGERNKVQNFLNLTFDGGFDSTDTYPLGWQVDATSGAGGSKEASIVVWGDAYRITGDGATAIRGMIAQSAYQDYLKVSILSPGTAYSVRVRLQKGGGIAAGNVVIDLFSITSGVLGTFSVPVSSLSSTQFTEFIGVLCTAQTTIPTDLALRLYLNGTPTNAGYVVFENVEPYPTALPYDTNFARISRSEDPESFDGVTGILQPSSKSGEAVRSAFVLRERLYLVKEHSLYVTQDDGVNEPSNWEIDTVSSVVGTESVNGVGLGEDWAIIADRNGLYIFAGPEPQKISQEIQPTWDRINWNAASAIWTKVDTKLRRVYVGVPLDSATSPSHILMLDYRGCSVASEISDNEPVHISSYSGKIVSLDKGRKWSIWTIAANSAGLIERTATGKFQFFLGNEVGNGKIYQLDDAALDDDGVAIPSYYWTFFFLPHDMEQQLQVGAHRKLFHYLTMYTEGTGQLLLNAALDTKDLAAQLIGLPSLTLYSPAANDAELPINLLAPRVAFKLAVDGAVGSWFRLARFVPSIKPDPWSPVRGHN